MLNPKTFFKAVLLAVMLPLAAQAQTAWQEGTHYEVVSDNATATPQVVEVFSFWCPHCFTFESIAAELKSKLPANVSFTKAHVNFMGTAEREVQDQATLAMLAARVMKDSERFNGALFRAVHEDRRNVTGINDIKAIYAEAGGDADKLEKLTTSFGIKGQVAKNNQLTKGLRRVPAFIVNGKYKAIFTRDMTPDNFVSLILWLITKKD